MLQASTSRVFSAAFVLLLLLSCSAVFADPIVYPNVGHPLSASLAQGGWVYYTVNPTIFGALNDTDYVSFMLTSLSGDADLHVSIVGEPNGADCTNCIFSSNTPFSEVQTVSRGDSSKWPTGTNVFTVGIQGYTASEVVFNVWASNSIVSILDGQPQQASTLRGSYTYFRYELTSLLSTNITIAVTPVDGDPDVYVSTQTATPNSGNYEWSSSLYGFDLVNIQHSTTSNPGLVYYIGVYSFTNTHYTIVVRNSDIPNPVRVVEGHPMSDMVEAGEMIYYVYENLVAQRILVSISPLTSRGDPDLYLKWNQKPTTDSYDYSSRSLGNDAIEIEPAQSKVGFFLYIGIRGFARDTKFQLLLTTENVNTALADGVSVGSSILAGETNYYKFPHADVQTDIITSVKVFRGSVTLYYSTHARPSPEKNERVGVMDGGLINMMFNITKAQTYYFAVRASANADYTITASTTQVPTVLRDGVDMFWNSVPKGYYRHFIFEADSFDTNDVSITVNPWLGDVDLYVSTADQFPVLSNYTWKADSWGEDTVYIPANDAKANGKNRFRISVYGYRDVNYFTILAMQSNTTIVIVEDETVPGTVLPRQYMYFSFDLPATSSIDVTLHLTTSNSEANFYYSRSNPKPNRQHNDGKSLNFGDDLLTIENAAAGKMYFAVHGVYSANNAPITFTFNIATNYHHLYANGQAVLVRVGQGKYVSFKGMVSSHIENFVASATLVSGSTTMYISTDGNMANSTHYNFVNAEWPGNAFFIQKTTPGFKNGFWYFSIYGNVESDFYMSLLSYPYNAWLREGVPVLAKAPTDGSPMVFSFWIPYVDTDDEKKDYTLHIRQITGQTSVYAIQDYYLTPSPTNNTFASTGSIDRTLILTKDKLNYGRSIYFGVYGAKTTDGSFPAFQITIGTALSPKFLGQDQPQAINVVDGEYNHFEALNRNYEDKVIVHVESCTTAPAPMIYMSSKTWRPSPTSPDTITSKASTKYPHDYAQIASVEALSEEKFWVAVGNNAKAVGPASIYVTTGDYSAPHVITSDLLGAAPLSPGKTVLNVKAANPSTKHVPGTLISYSLYIAPIALTDDESAMNMQTACGVQQNGKLVQTVQQIGEQVTFEFAVTKTEKYLINVLASDSFGRSSPYKAAYVIDGMVVDVPNLNGGVNVPALVISLLLIIVIGALVAYIGIGMGLRFKKGFRGIEMFPNYEFWKMVFTCGRSSSYTQFDEDRVNTSGFGSTNAGKGETQPITGGGYGSI